MADAELDLLKKEVAALTAKVAELRYDLDFMGKEFMRMNEDTTGHFSTIYDRLGEYMYPAFNQLFPEYETVKGQIEKIIGPAEEIIDPTAPPKNP